ncbi:hypothetical protein L1887_20317 [Cichorium endivia]|nr:hypothetical protein L1887_20317 [Cichorium endivia]
MMHSLLSTPSIGIKPIADFSCRANDWKISVVDPKPPPPSAIDSPIHTQIQHCYYQPNWATNATIRPPSIIRHTYRRSNKTHYTVLSLSLHSLSFSLAISVADFYSLDSSVRCISPLHQSR